MSNFYYFLRWIAHKRHDKNVCTKIHTKINVLSLIFSLFFVHARDVTSRVGKERRENTVEKRGTERRKKCKICVLENV